MRREPLVALQAELVALRVGEHHPAAAIDLPAIVDHPRSEGEQPVELESLRAVRGDEVDVHSVLLPLRLSYGDEDEAKALLIGRWPDEPEWVARSRLIAGRLTGRPRQNLACASGSAQSWVTLRIIEVMASRSDSDGPCTTSFQALGSTDWSPMKREWSRAILFRLSRLARYDPRGMGGDDGRQHQCRRRSN